MKIVILTYILLAISLLSDATGLNQKQIDEGLPPRIIRTCCAFGNNVGIIGIPFIKKTDIVAVENIGQHRYLGGKSEKNGLIYTLKGGFIDTGHLRDQADWTAYLQSIILRNRGNRNTSLSLGYEGGKKILKLDIPEAFSPEDAALLAGRITYDLSVWHEIATWYGASSVPFVPERYSSFSAEDDYSNQLGITLGIEALLSKLPYEQAMDSVLTNQLLLLEAVTDVKQSYAAMDLVNGKWWSGVYKYPSKNLLLKHEISSYDTTFPLLVDELKVTSTEPVPVEVAKLSSNNESLNNFYKLSFYVNGKIPYTRIFHKRKSRKLISNEDFLVLLKNIEIESSLMKYRRFKRKSGRNKL